MEARERMDKETEKSVRQSWLNLLLQRPTVSSLIIGAQNAEQRRQNLAAEGWSLSPAQVTGLDRASEQEPVYPYWHQWQFAERNPPPIRR